MQAANFVLLLILGLGQTISAWRGWRGASFSGPYRWVGVGLGGALTLLGAKGLISSGWSGGVMALAGWIIVCVLLALALLLAAGSIIQPPPHPDSLFSPTDPRHGGCERLDIPDGPHHIPALLLQPRLGNQSGGAVCLLHGSGDNKTGFKWLLVEALLAQGLNVLTLDLPGHGDYLHRPLAYPDSLSTVSAALQFLQQQPGVERTALVGLSLGGAMALSALAAQPELKPNVLVLLATPLAVTYNRQLVWREAWRTMNAPVMHLFKEITVRQIWQSWQQGAIRSRHSTAEMFRLLDPLGSIRQLPETLPILMVYGRRDPIAPASFGETLQAAAPHVELVVHQRTSHLTLTLTPKVNHQVTAWIRNRVQQS